MPTSDESVPVRVLQDIVIIPPDEDVEMPMPDVSEPVETLEHAVNTTPDEHLSSMEITPDVGSFERNNHDEDSGKGEAAQISSSKRKLDKDSLKPAKQKRARRTTDEEREASLNANANISTVETHRECPAITGTRLIRSQNKPVKSVVKGSISTFFTAPGKASTSQALKVVDPDSDSESESPKHPGYTSRRVKATPSIATFFQPGPIKNDPPRPPPAVPEPRSCAHLAGGKYTEYIRQFAVQPLEPSNG
ncbi:hypothetical protein B0H14DRAFT_3862134 [Mycena olivaceomarginata]|nr:hypothetical protein B0H14DRAFT_3862134 [Mycena olivaceomarginata]